ncbi:hypothetical protein AKO1_005168 [Acrasis kona]|uniref:NAD(P)-binding domain-containing protein n=1 Tax=Acrasis kona TaxID=1008807 RepID=A0AAW2Z6A6_9EUKA
MSDQLSKVDDIDWVIVRAARLTDGSRTKEYRIATTSTQAVNAYISRADVADFILDLTKDSQKYIKNLPFINY